MTSLNISLPEALKEYVEGQVASGDWGTPSEYVRELIRQDKERRLGNLEQDLIAAAKGPKIELPVAEIARKGLLARFGNGLDAGEKTSDCPQRCGGRRHPGAVRLVPRAVRRQAGEAMGECGNVSCLARCENVRRRSTMQVQVDRASWCTTHCACWIPKTFALL